jgi:hypothetical protein
MKTKTTTKHQTKMKMQRMLAAFSAALLTMAGTGFAAYGQDATTTTPPATPAPDATSAPAAPVGDASWRFSAMVPLWAPSISGDATVLGHQKNVNIGFNTLKDHLETAVSLGLQARTPKYGVYAGISYMKFTAAGANAYAELQFVVAEGGGFYRLVKVGDTHPFILEGLAGVRAWYTDTKIDIVPIGFSGGKVRDLVDPIVGLRGSQVLFSKCHADFQGDFGGFNISYHKDIDYSASAVLTYDIVRWFSVSAGYKTIGLDVNDGAARTTGFNLNFHGPLIVAKVTF